MFMLPQTILYKNFNFGAIFRPLSQRKAIIVNVYNLQLHITNILAK